MTNNSESGEEAGGLEGTEEVAPEDVTPLEDERPPYLREEEPTSKLDKAKYWLLRGKTSEELAAEGHNPGTVRTAKSQLVSEGLLEKKPRGTPPGGKGKSGVGLVPQTPSRGMQVFAKGSPPEALINALEIPAGADGSIVQFESGMKFGMSILVTAVRVVNEMSIIGSQQVRPLLDMSKAMREGEAMSYKAGAEEAAYKAADAMGRAIVPQVAEIQGAVEAMRKDAAGGGNPMQAMMVRTMEPLIQNLVGGMFPGMNKAETPPGWKKREE